MSDFVIGDIQGCFDELRELLKVMGFRAGSDRLWLVGDLVNRGPRNLDTIKLVMDLPDSVMVLGNHDLHFLAVALVGKAPGRRDTLQDLLDSPLLDDIVSWLLQQPLAHYDETLDVLMVHAGVPPMWDVDSTLRHSAEVETVLQSQTPDRFLNDMYGDLPDLWDENLAGTSRLRLITNYLTRLRFCQESGRIELKHKTDVAPAGYVPWFTVRGKVRPPTRIVFGHWAAIDGKTGTSTSLALDTGCVWGRSLTGLRLEDGKLFSVRARQAYGE